MNVPVPGYELGEVLGRGGFASVYRAVQVSVGREVAVKIDNRVLAGERDRRRFLRELTAAGRLSGHPHSSPSRSRTPTATLAPWSPTPTAA